MTSPHPCPDRTPRGYLRWRVWARFFAAGFWTGIIARNEVVGPWSLAMAVSVALGLPAALALWDTRRTEGAATRGDDRSRT
jgi:ABC-type spermidine/putrescine transport system permease subunit II